MLSAGGDPSVVRAALERMITVLRHRGPDRFGFHVEAPIAMAHARLGIIDLATGDQPMTNEAGTVWTVFNGEIFNYIELRAALQAAGHVFRTHSDTETIVHAYEEYGDAFVEHLNGQFAIALWDAPRRRLVLARDRAGIRPLFVHLDGDRWLFGSEIKAILAVSSQPPRLDLEGLSQVFTFWAPVGERTVFRGVRAVRPGEILIIEGSRVRSSRYWQWSFPPIGGERRISFEEAAEELRVLLEDAVRLQLRADVPVGSYMSGGLDSAVLTGLIRNHSNASLRTFSIGFEEAEFDERPYQQELADHFGTNHTTMQCKAQQIGELFPRLIEHTEVPVLRTAPVPMMMLSGLVHRAGLKVVLTGEGADEVFAGYDLFKEAKIRRFWARQPDSRWRPGLFRRLYPYLRHSPVSVDASSQSFFRRGLQDVNHPFYGHRQRWMTTRRLWNFLSRDVQVAMADLDPECALYASLPEGFERWAGLSKDQYVEAQTLLFGYLLSSQGDRVSMANSVEGRVPFLDHRVIEFANSLPPSYKLRRLTEKAVLRAASRDLLPQSILNRVKQPYRAPDNQAFFADGKPLDFVANLLSEGRLRDAGYFEPAAVRRLVEKCREGRAIGFADNMAFVGVLSTMLLDDLFIRRRVVEG